MKIKVCHVSAILNHSLPLDATAKFVDKDKYELSSVFLDPARPKLADKIAAMGIETTWIK